MHATRAKIRLHARFDKEGGWVIRSSVWSEQKDGSILSLFQEKFLMFEMDAQRKRSFVIFFDY